MIERTSGPWIVEPYLTPDRDDDPMGVYIIKNCDLQDRYDNVDVENEKDDNKLDEIHEENRNNANLISAVPQLYLLAVWAKNIFDSAKDTPEFKMVLNALGISIPFTAWMKELEKAIKLADEGRSDEEKENIQTKSS